MSSIVRYAQTGAGVDSIEDQLASLLPLYRSALGAASTALDELESEPPQTFWGLALAGAQARSKLARNQPISGREVAVLASITYMSIRVFTRQGELTPINDTRPALYDARQARQWLVDRGVPGLSTRRRK